jgi:sugar/nucleoside kinase (ribokinase family)
LDRMDEEDTEFGTVAARFLHELQKREIKTSLDLVSENSERFARIVRPALRFCNFLIINDFESEKVTGIPIRSADRIIKKNLKPIAKKIFEYGVSDMVVIHFPEGGYLLTNNDEEILQPSLSLPEDFIAGSTGAGDSFCAGILYGLYRQWDILTTIRLAICAGAQNLADVTTTGAIGAWQDIMKLADRYSFRLDISR